MEIYFKHAIFAYYNLKLLNMLFDNKVPNAQKWNKENVYTCLVRMEQDARKPGTMYLVDALNNESLYKDIWRYWKRTFAREDDIIEMMLRIESLFEAKLFVGGLKKELAPTLAIFGLKYNHKWKEKHSEGM